MKHARYVLALCLVAGLAFASLAPQTLAAEYKVRLGWVTADHPSDLYAVGAREFKTRIEEMSGGRIEVELYPNRQLGDEKELLEGVRFGTVDAAMIANGILSTVVSGYQVNDLPFIYLREQQAYDVLDGPIGQQLAAEIRERGVVVLGYMEAGFRHMMNNVRPVHVPQDVSGVKYRVQQSPVFIAMFTALGGNAVPMAWGETFTALQQGTIDGIEMPVPFILSGKFYEVTKYLSLTNHIYAIVALTMSARTYDKLPDDLKGMVDKAARDATEVQRETSRNIGQSVLAELKQHGMEVNTVADLSAFRQAVRPAYEDFRGSIGSEVLDSVLEAVAE